MDKPKKGHTIKIKLNGENKAIQKEPQTRELEESAESETRVIKINRNPAEADGFLESAAAKESIDESFDWIIPESSENDIEEFKMVSQHKTKKTGPKKLISFSTKMKKKNDRSLAPIFVSAFFAILIGTTIGISMLKLVNTTEPVEKAGTKTPVVEEKGKSETKAAAGKTTSAVIGQLTAYVIQGGVYTSKDGAKETSRQITAKGVPSQVVELNGQHYIFLGVADSSETAKLLGNQYKEKGVEDPFPKSLLLKEKKVTDITDKEKAFLETVPSIYETLSLATASGLVSKAIPEKAGKAIPGAEEQLKVDGIRNEKVKSLKAELTNANEKIRAYQKSKDAKSLTEAQQHLLNFLSDYYSL